jgi:hypothetical protein
MDNVLFPSLYEEDYILRSLGSIVTQPDVALTELVANAWDAGASHVTLSIPEEKNQLLYIEDDGVGMSESEFQHHWMTLRYNRLKEQGRNVIFPNGEKGNRCAFGRNGVGRHGLFCFGNEYKVITIKDGKKLTFKIKPNVESQPFAVIEKKEETSTGNGTRLEVIVTKNLPAINKISEILSARFLHDPQFKITVNHKTLELEDLTGETEPAGIDIEGTNIHLTAYFIDSTKAGRKSIFQGIAFWQSGRLVGEPSWSLGRNLVLDGRTSLAKRYTFIIKSNDLADMEPSSGEKFGKVAGSAVLGAGIGLGGGLLLASLIGLPGVLVAGAVGAIIGGVLTNQKQDAEETYIPAPPKEDLEEIESANETETKEVDKEE